MDLSDEGDTLIIQFCNYEGFCTGGYILYREADGEGPGDGNGPVVTPDVDNPATGDINMVVVAITSVIALAGIVIVGISLKKASARR